MNRGFTLVEMLVVIAVLTLTGGLLLTIFTQSLRGSNKSQIILAIKQNGQGVMDTFDKTIRNADNVVCPLPLNPTNTLVLVKDGKYTRYRLIPQPLDNSINGYVAFDNPTPSPSEMTPLPFINRVCNPENLLSNPTILTDRNTITGVSLISEPLIPAQFKMDRLAGFKDKITIEFRLDQGVGVTGALASEVDPVTFKTTVELR